MTRHSCRPAKHALWLPLMLSAMAFVGAPLPATAEQVAAHVDITDAFRFDPDRVTIHVGQTIEWTNRSHFRHTVTDDPAMAGQSMDAMLPSGAKGFSSEELAPGSSFRLTLTVPGTYKYFCMPHEGIGMLGEIIVLPAN
jgi:plastocyanin